MTTAPQSREYVEALVRALYDLERLDGKRSSAEVLALRRGFDAAWHAARAAAATAAASAVPVLPPEPDHAMSLSGALEIPFDTPSINKLWIANAVYRAMMTARLGCPR